MDFDKDYFYGMKKSNYFCYGLFKIFVNYGEEIKFIKKNKINGRLLDAGCAFGFFLKKAGHLFKEFKGCDISKFAIQKAGKNLKNADLKIADISKKLPYPDNYFDLVACFDVLEHTKSFEKSLKNIAKKAKKKGYLIISTPIMNFLRKNFWIDIDKSHISIPTEKELESFIENSGLKIIKKSYVYPFFPIGAKYYLQKK